MQKGKGAVLTLGYGLAAPLAFEGDEGNGNAVSHSQVRPDNRLFIMRHPVANGPNNPNRKQASKQKSNKVASDAPRSLPLRCCYWQPRRTFYDPERKSVSKNLKRPVPNNHTCEIVGRNHAIPLAKGYKGCSDDSEDDYCARFHSGLAAGILLGRISPPFHNSPNHEACPANSCGSQAPSFNRYENLVCRPVVFHNASVSEQLVIPFPAPAVMNRGVEHRRNREDG